MRGLEQYIKRPQNFVAPMVPTTTTGQPRPKFKYIKCSSLDTWPLRGERGNRTASQGLGIASQSSVTATSQSPLQAAMCNGYVSPRYGMRAKARTPSSPVVDVIPPILP